MPQILMIAMCPEQVFGYSCGIVFVPRRYRRHRDEQQVPWRKEPQGRVREGTAAPDSA